MNIGIVGAGNMGRNHIRICKKLQNSYKNLNLCAIYDPHVPEYNNKKKFFNKVSELDGVIVATPSVTHTDICLELFSIKPEIKVLVEKPVDDDLDKAKLLLPHEKNITVGHIERFNPAVKKLKFLLDSNSITGPNAIRTKRLNHTTSRATNYVNLDLLVHDIDVASFLLNARLKTKNIIKSQTNSDGIVDHAVLTGVFSNSSNTLLVAEASWVEPEKVRTLELVCNEGKYSLDYIKQTLTHISFTGQKNKIEVIKNEPLCEEILHFISFVEGQNLAGCSVADALAAVKESS